jgi:hypothetical protein
MRALLLCVLVGGVVGVGFWQCNPNSIGRPCVNPQGSDVRGTQISSPALECPSRLCLITKENAKHTETDGGATAVCTAECSNNGDCDAESKASCKSGFACAIVTTAGNFCCRKLCVCKEDLDPELNQDPIDGGVVIPHACDPQTYKTSGQTPQCANIKL